jgi:hypothetical protein
MQMLEREAKRKYFIELGGTIVLYVLVLSASIRIGRPMEAGLGRTLVLMLPVIPLLLSAWAIVRAFGRMDEFVRLRTLESFGVAGAVTAALTFAYGFMETAGYPRLSMFWVWGIMGFAWGTVQCLRPLVKK